MSRSALCIGFCLFLLMDVADAAESELTVVEDAGGQSALPYYRRLHLPEKNPGRGPGAPPAPTSLAAPYSEAQMLPVRSERLRPGRVLPKAIHAPGLQPIFLIGNDSLSRTWLQNRLSTLSRLGAVGIVVQVESASALEDLRQLARGLVLVPASGDELAQRLGLQHYPLLITATGTEQ
jgi:integrating conjugative element protein (TIGR03765 family)